MAAVQRAPSAMNKQPVMFSYEDGRVRASVSDTTKYLVGFDLGIAKLHFELGSGGGAWEWGSGAEFVYGKSRNKVRDIKQDLTIF